MVYSAVIQILTIRVQKKLYIGRHGSGRHGRRVRFNTVFFSTYSRFQTRYVDYVKANDDDDDDTNELKMERMRSGENVTTLFSPFKF